MCLALNVFMKSIKCHHCKEEVQLTWKVWWRMQQALLICPSCLKASRVYMVPSWSGYLLFFTQFFPFVILGLAFVEGINLAWVFPILLVSAIFDKYLRGKYAIAGEPTNI